MDIPEYDEKSVRKFLRLQAKDVLKEALERFQSSDFDVESLEKILRGIAEEKGLSFSKVAQPLRVAVTGSHVSPPIFDTLHLLGKEQTIKRVEYALENLPSRGN